MRPRSVISFLLIFVVLFTFKTVGQSQPADSLTIELKNAKSDTVRCQIYLNLANSFDLSRSDSAFVLWKKCAALAMEYAPRYKKDSRAYYVLINQFCDAYSNIGTNYIELGDLSKATEYHLKSLEERKKVGEKLGVAISYNCLGLIEKEKGNVPQSLHYYEQSLKLYEELGDLNGKATMLINIGALYNEHGEIEKGLEYLLQAKNIYMRRGDKKGAALVLNNMGFISYNNAKYDEALKYHEESLKIRETLGEKSTIAQSLLNIGAVYEKTNDDANATKCYQRSLDMRRQLGDAKGISNALYIKGKHLLKMNKVKEAEACAKESMEIALKISFPGRIRNAASLLSDVYKITGNYKQALENYELFIKMRDSISNDENKKATYKSQIKYQYEKQALADSLEFVKQKEVKEKEIEKQKAEIKAKRSQQYALFGGLALVIIFAGFMYNRFKVTQQQKNIIEGQKIIVEEQKHLVEEKHKEITDSINYAERIQRSFIATKEILDENLSDYFVMFKPKDVVSGDFYWAGKLNNGNFALATADSTGHGVPGAIMSLLNITSIEKAIETETQPAAILNSTRKTIIERLKKDGSEHGGKDGMDASLTVYDFKNNKLIIAAANNPVWIVRGSEVIDIKADKMPVGKHDKDTISFTQQEIDLQKGDLIYTLTDGYPDQFGGEKGKKFMSKNLRELLFTNSHLPMNEQKSLLEKKFADWVGNLEQVDDVTLIGVRV